MSIPDPVLVVDDDGVSRLILRQALADAGLPSEDVMSGTAALGWMRARTPSLVMLDLMMPDTDGYEVLAAMRADERLREVPVVVLTALDRDSDVARAFDLGADDFIRKPFRPVELLARIQSQLRMREYVLAAAHRERDAQVVLEITQALASSLDIRTILYTVVRRIAEVARVDRCSIVLTRDKGDVGYVVAASDDQDLHDLPIDVEKYPEIGKVLETGEPLVISDVKEHPLLEVVRSGLPSHAFRSLAILPITFDDRRLGVLFLRGHRPIAMGDHELSLARTVASATAIALRNARMVQTLRSETQRSTFARFEAERRMKVLERYVDFFNASADGIVVLDAEGHVVFSNPQARELTGYSEEELAEAPFHAVVDAHDRPRFEAILADAARGELPPALDLTLSTRSGRASERRIASVSFGSLLREDSALLVTLRDVTAERTTATELTKTKDFLERVIDSSVDAIISADLRGNVLLFNRAAERCYGYDAKDVVGQLNVRDLYPAGTATNIMRLIRSGGAGGPGRLEGYRTDVLDKAGMRVPVLLSAALILEDGRPVGSVGIFTDLRERLQMEARLEQAEEDLRAKEKQAIVAELAGAAAHELNQPLTSVMGYAELLEKRLARPADATSEGERTLLHAATIILRESERMAEIVRKIGKITRYETKSYVGDARIVDLDRASGDGARDTTTDPPAPAPWSDSHPPPSVS